jgi:cation:H+ antiporter
LNLLRSEESDIEVNNQESGLVKVIFFTILSLLVLIIGSELTVTGAESIAIYFGLSEVIIGLSIIAVGTSLPELAATVAAIRQNKSLIVIGNILGSNFLNIVVVFPIIAFGSNEVFDGAIFTRDFLIMSIFSALFILALVVGRQKDGLSRILFYGFGLMFISGYLIYLVNLFI